MMSKHIECMNRQISMQFNHLVIKIFIYDQFKCFLKLSDLNISILQFDCIIIIQEFAFRMQAQMDSCHNGAAQSSILSNLQFHANSKRVLRLRSQVIQPFESRISSGKSRIKKGFFNSSFWKLSENIAYMQFLKVNENLFYTSKQNKKAMKLNVMMMRAVKTRSADQCRSHHQKMIKYHHDIPNIIRHIQQLAELQAKQNTKIEQNLSQNEANVQLLVGQNLENFQIPVLNNFLEMKNDWEYCINFESYNQIWSDQKIVQEFFEEVDLLYRYI